ncbi:MAG: hypothetical protein U1E46_17855 [Hyphomicrobiales bacterium]
MRAVSQRHTNVFVVCSDISRTGKTLLARLVMDYLLLALRNPFAFDTTPSPGSIVAFYPERSMHVDLSRTAGQMALFDTILNSPPRDFVIDLDTQQFARFFSVVREIDFLEELSNRRIALGVLFLADPTNEPIAVAARLTRLVPPKVVTLVLNQALAPAGRSAQRKEPVLPLALSDMAVMTLPVLDRDVARETDRAPFSFAGVVEGWMRRFEEDRLLRLLKFLNQVVPLVRKTVTRLDQQEPDVLRTV